MQSKKINLSKTEDTHSKIAQKRYDPINCDDYMSKKIKHILIKSVHRERSNIQVLHSQTLNPNAMLKTSFLKFQNDISNTKKIHQLSSTQRKSTENVNSNRYTQQRWKHAQEDNQKQGRYNFKLKRRSKTQYNQGNFMMCQGIFDDKNMTQKNNAQVMNKLKSQQKPKLARKPTIIKTSVRKRSSTLNFTNAHSSTLQNGHSQQGLNVKEKIEQVNKSLSWLRILNGNGFKINNGIYSKRKSKQDSMAGWTPKMKKKLLRLNKNGQKIKEKMQLNSTQNQQSSSTQKRVSNIQTQSLNFLKNTSTKHRPRISSTIINQDVEEDKGNKLKNVQKQYKVSSKNSLYRPWSSYKNDLLFDSQGPKI